MIDAASSVLVILLHGLGSNGADLAPLSRAWSKALPGAVFASPNAPERSSFGPGFQWFSIDGVTEGNRAARIASARAGFDAVISAIVEEHGFTGRLGRVALVGFSQGTIMSLDAVASGRWPVGAVVGFSGRLATPEPMAVKHPTPILLIHGTGDQVIPSWETERAATKLTELGLPVETMIESGLPHTISAEGAERAGEFLGKTFAD
jgi:phospholipase/carboxylesterase